MKKLFTSLLIVTAMLALTACDSKKGVYNNAIKEYDAGNYEVAESMFAELGDYEDSAKQKASSTYNKAGKLFSAGKYEEALAAYTSINRSDLNEVFLGSLGRRIASCYANLVKAEVSAVDLEKAEKRAEEMLKAFPSPSEEESDAINDALYSLAKAFDNKDIYDKALNYYVMSGHENQALDVRNKLLYSELVGTWFLDGIEVSADVLNAIKNTGTAGAQLAEYCKMPKLNTGFVITIKETGRVTKAYDKPDELVEIVNKAIVEAFNANYEDVMTKNGYDIKAALEKAGVETPWDLMVANAKTQMDAMQNVNLVTGIQTKVKNFIENGSTGTLIIDNDGVYLDFGGGYRETVGYLFDQDAFVLTVVAGGQTYVDTYTRR